MARRSKPQSVSSKSRKAQPKPPPSQPGWFTTFTDWLRQRQWTRFIILWAVAYMVLVSFFLRTVLRNDAYLEIFPRELLFPMALHALTALFVTAILYWMPWLRSFLAKLLAVLVLSLFTMAYDTNLQAAGNAIRAFTPGLTGAESWPIISLIYLCVLITLSTFIGYKVANLISRSDRIKLRDAQLAVVVIAAYLCILPVFSTFRVLPAMIRESRIQAPEYSKPTAAAPTDKPDIYYIILDRYTNADVLQKQFNFDNTPFTGFLRNAGFTVNDTAHANYPYTTMSVSSTLNAMYTNQLVAPFKATSVQSRTLYHNTIWQSSVVKALKQQGYQYHAIGSTYGASYKAPLADQEYMANHILTVFGKQKRLRGIEALQFMNSPFYRFAQLGHVPGWPFSITDTTEVQDVSKQLATLTNLAASSQQGGRFIFAHILVPHDPFLFNADGSLSVYTNADNIGHSIKQKYTNQVAFMNTQIKTLVSTIQEHSGGKAVILLNADEGAYPNVMNSTFQNPSGVTSDAETGSNNEDMTQWSDDFLQMKFGILQAAYIPRATSDDLAALSSVNLFRIILNRYASYALPYLPDCHYGLSDGGQNEYRYADITARLESNPDKRCSSMQTFPAREKTH